MSFCPNCGTEVKVGARFCTGCGKPVDGQPAPTPQYTAPQYTAPQSAPNNNKPKKGKKAGRVIWGIIVAFIAIGIATSVAHNNSDKKSNDKEYSGESTENQIETGDKEPNPEYLTIFEERGIVDESALLAYGHLTSSEHVTVLSDGIVDKMEYGSQDDMVKVIVETVYYPTAGYSDDQISQIEQAMRDQFVAAESLPFCTITYTNIDGYLKIEVFMEDLDHKTSLVQAAEAGILMLTESAADYLSHEMSISVAESSGYVSKY